MGAQSHELLETVVSSAKASISVILVLLYGYMLRRYGWIKKEAESNISKIGTTFLLPALLFTEIGPLATPSNLKTYWPILPFSLLFQAISLAVAVVSHRFGSPVWITPAFVFTNVTSLPLLLISALAQTGSLDSLAVRGEDVKDVLQRATVYVLLNALVGNVTRFLLGPYLMKTHNVVLLRPHEDDPHAPTHEGGIRLPDSSEEDETPETAGEKFVARARSAWSWIVSFGNPPLLGGLAGVFFGVIPWTNYQLFDGDGWLSPLAGSLKNLGGLYTALQMLVLGAHLYSKTGTSATKAPKLALSWLFVYRFFLAPVISIATIYGTPDPVLDFVLMLSNVGPPAITLSAISEMAGVSSEVEGQVAQMLTLSYAVTPLIALSVTASLHAVKASGIGQ